jgi:hypothetical protein
MHENCHEIKTEHRVEIRKPTELSQSESEFEYVKIKHNALRDGTSFE